MSKSIGQRALSADDQALFATGTEAYTWDVGPNHKGYLRYWQTFAPGAPTTAAITLDLGNNNQGQRTSTIQTTTLAGYPTLMRQVTRDYYLDGATRNAFYDDSIGGINATSSR